MVEQTLIIVKPDAVKRSLTGKILTRFERKGFQIVKLKMLNFTKDIAEVFYSDHKSKPFFGELVSFITSGQVVAAVIEANNAISTTRLMIGATKSFEAEFEAEKIWTNPIVTEVTNLGTFYPAEEYHYEYYKRNPYQGYCQVVITSKLTS